MNLCILKIKIKKRYTLLLCYVHLFSLKIIIKLYLIFLNRNESLLLEWETKISENELFDLCTIHKCIVNDKTNIITFFFFFSSEQSTLNTARF
jgi:hypothetical protein